MPKILLLWSYLYLRLMVQILMRYNIIHSNTLNLIYDSLTQISDNQNIILIILNFLIIFFKIWISLLKHKIIWKSKRHYYGLMFNITKLLGTKVHWWNDHCNYLNNNIILNVKYLKIQSYLMCFVISTHIIQYSK